MQSTPMGTERQDYTRLIRQTLLAALSSTFAVVLFIRTALELSFLTTIVIPFFQSPITKVVFILLLR